MYKDHSIEQFRNCIKEESYTLEASVLTMKDVGSAISKQAKQ
jgi:hypothetical protein